MKAKKEKIKGDTSYHWVCPKCGESICHRLHSAYGFCDCRDDWIREWNKEDGLNWKTSEEN